MCRSQTQCLSVSHKAGKCNSCPPVVLGCVSTQGPVNLILLTELSVLLMLVDEELSFLLGDADYFADES